MKFLTSVGVVAFLILSGGVTQAAPITFEFPGFIDSVYEPNNEFGGMVHVGDLFIVRYSFDTLTPDLLPDDQNGLYQGTAASLVLPDVTYDASTAGLDVILSSNVPTLFFWTPMSATVPRIYTSFTGMPLSSHRFPTEWTGATGLLHVKSVGSSGELKGTIAPEPATLMLILIGLFSIRRRG
jgi:hypothetical protein